MKQTGKYVIAGALAGILNGLFGAGGGLMLVPLLGGWAGMEETHSFATAVAVMFPLSAVSYLLFCLQGGNVWADALPYLLGGIAGGLLSARLFTKLSPVWLHRLFGGLILFGGIKAVLGL